MFVCLCCTCSVHNTNKADTYDSYVLSSYYVSQCITAHCRAMYHSPVSSSVSWPSIELCIIAQYRAMYHGQVSSSVSQPSVELCITAQCRALYDGPVSSSVWCPSIELCITAQYRALYHGPVSSSVSWPSVELLSRPSVELCITAQCSTPVWYIIHGGGSFVWKKKCLKKKYLDSLKASLNISTI